MLVFLSLLPDILMIAIGGLIRRKLPADGWKAVDLLNFHLLFPALIFMAASGARLDFKDLITLGAGTWSIMAVGCGLGWLIRPMGPERFLDFAGLWQTAWRFNAAIALVAVQVFPDQVRGYAAIAIGTAVPIANIMAISALSRGNALRLGQILRQIGTNPFFLASFLGLLVSGMHIELPSIVSTMIGKLSVAAVPMALLSIGASLNWRSLAGLDRFTLLLNGIKLLVLPAFAWAVGLVLELNESYVIALVLFAALPTASAAHILASVFGADREKVSTLIAQSTIMGCLTLPLWMALLT
jgi:malonate transporter